MSLGLLGLGGDWRRLYSTDLDGNHFTILQQALIGYHGKTVLLIRCTNNGGSGSGDGEGGAVFGYYTETPWRISQSWYGAEGDSFLFRLSPVLDMYGRVYDQSSSASQYAMYLNPTPVTNRNRKAEEALAGLAVGGIADHIPRLHLNKDLENCKACSIDLAYQSGPLLDDDWTIFFDIDVLELWAVQVPDDEVFQAGCESGKKQMAIHEAQRIKAAKVVDRSQFLSDLESNEFRIRAKIYSHRDEVRGRHEFVAHDASGHGYFVEDHRPSVHHLTVPDDDDDE
jgi:hypothetical protein